MLMQEQQNAERRTKDAGSAERWTQGLKADQYLGFHASAAQNGQITAVLYDLRSVGQTCGLDPFSTPNHR